MKKLHPIKKNNRLTFVKMAGLLSLAAMNSVAQAGLYAPPAEATPAPVVSSFADHLYVGVFGGGGWLSATDNNQSGTAFYSTPALVDANGVSDTTDVGLVGLNVGYKWSDIALKQDSAWSLTPAVELEGYYLWGTQNVDPLVNSYNLEHTFSDSYPMETGVFLVNGILSFNHDASKLHPYLGAGVGTAIVSIEGANSAQIAPSPEPGINHYNSDPNASDWTFAAQAKAGVRYAITPKVGVFAEYRFLYLAPTDYVFGSTEYASHVPTTNWDVSYDPMYYNMLTVGIQFDA